jgi:hypothetical protein
MDLIQRRGFRIAVEACLGLFAAVLCWVDVSWAFRPGLFPIQDELSNPTLFLDGSYHQIVHFIPSWFFCDRPLGWAFVKLMDDFFRFNYTRQLECFLAIHFANTGMVFLLFRRLGVSVPISIAGVGLFGGLWTTAATATYPGAAHDMICLFFLLGSVLAILSERRGASILSAVLFLAALRSKEFGIVAPVALTVLVALRLPRMPLLRTLAAVARRLWLHYLIALLIGLRYASLYRAWHAQLPPGDPYRADLHVTTVLKSLAYYTALIFGAEESKWQLPPVALAVGLGAVLCWAVVRRRAGLAFGVCAFVLTILPVALMPNQRATFYAYAPQVFLILVLCLLVDEAIGWRRNPAHLRWIAAVCIALAVFSWCLTFRRSSYFRDRINFTITVRRISARTAHQVDAQLPPMGPETHVYVDHAADTRPWLFIAGPCSYLRLVNRQRDIFCEVDKNSDQLRAQYAADPGPKYLIDYNDDGSFTVAASRVGPSTAANR